MRGAGEGCRKVAFSISNPLETFPLAKVSLLGNLECRDDISLDFLTNLADRFAGSTGTLLLALTVLGEIKITLLRIWCQKVPILRTFSCLSMHLAAFKP
jgi:hypothetical protein